MLDNQSTQFPYQSEDMYANCSNYDTIVLDNQSPEDMYDASNNSLTEHEPLPSSRLESTTLGA